MAKLTTSEIVESTRLSERYYLALKDRLACYEQDEARDRRLLMQECRSCFYLHGHGGFQAITPYTCGHCAEPQFHSDTSTPQFCLRCARMHDACCRCGSAI